MIIVFQIIGLILIAITYLVHKRTYSVEYKYKWSDNRRECSYSKIQSPLWVWLLAIIVNIIPGISIAAFIIGLIGYIVNYTEGDIILKYNPESKYYKCWNKIKIILTKDV